MKHLSCTFALFLFSGIFSLSLGFYDSLSLQVQQESDLSRKPISVSGDLTEAEWDSVKKQIRRNQYRAHYGGKAGYSSANPAHDFRIDYGADGVTTLSPYHSEKEDYYIGMRLKSIGYSGALKELPAKPIKLHSEAIEHSAGSKVTYTWSDQLREWWINDPNTLEQWFSLDEAPEGQVPGQPLRLRLALDTDMTVTVKPDQLSFVKKSQRINYEKFKVWDAKGEQLAVYFEGIENGLDLVINDAQAEYPLLIDPAFAQVDGYFRASNTEGGSSPDSGGGGDQFGYALAIDGNTLVVSAQREYSNATGVDGNQSDNSAPNAGAVYIFELDGNDWVQKAYLKASNTEAGDVFGSSVAIEGDTVVVGATSERSNATGVDGNQNDNSTDRAGAAYVFVRNGDTWSQQAYLKASNTGAEYDVFGFSVAVKGDTVAVGAIGEQSNATGVNGDQSDTSSFRSGAVYVFVRSGSSWSQQAYLKAFTSTALGSFGQSLSFGPSADQLFVGEPGGNAVYTFVRSGAVWSEGDYISPANADTLSGETDQFGYSLSIEGDTLVVGAPGEDSDARGVNGDEFNNEARGAGAAYVFVRSGGSWSQQAFLKASNAYERDGFGRAVAIEGEVVLVGAPGEDMASLGIDGDQDTLSWTAKGQGSGAAYAFVRDGSTWSQQAYIKPGGTEVMKEQLFGDEHSIVLSDGKAIIGAALADSAAPNGEQPVWIDVAGIVYTYTLDTSSGGSEVAGGCNSGAHEYESLPSSAISDNACTNVSIPVTDDFVISELSVGLNITHSYRGDLTMSLVAPDNTRAVLYGRHGSSGNNLDLSFDDSHSTLAANIGTTSHNVASPFYENEFKPNDVFDAFNGMSSVGNWVVEVCDGANSDTGTVNQVLLEFTCLPAEADGSISGVVYVDNNKNDSYDAGTESGIGSIAVSLRDGTDGSIILTTNTAANGSYSFDGLDSSLTYRVEVDVTDSDLPSDFTMGTTNPLTAVTVAASDNNFGFDKPNTFSIPPGICTFDGDIYYNTPSQLRRYNLPTGQDSLLANLSAVYGDIAFTTDGTLYGVTFSLGNYVIDRVDPVTGVPTIVLSGDELEDANSLSADELGWLYFGSSSETAHINNLIYRFLPGQMNSPELWMDLSDYGFGGGASAGDFIFIDDIVYMAIYEDDSNRSGGPVELLKVDNLAFDHSLTASSTVTSLGVIGSDIWGLAGNQEGDIFAVSGGSNEVLRIQLSPFQVTSEGSLSGQPYGASSLVDASGVACSIQGDYSDAPASYGDAIHDIISGIQLGAAIDSESVSLASANADGDGSDDDGITIPTMERGESTFISAAVSGSGGFLQAWIDWNADGDFADSGEQIATDLQLSSGTSGSISVPVTVPLSATTNQTFARFRWSTTAGLDSTMTADDGEVEDYALAVVSLTPIDAIDDDFTVSAANGVTGGSTTTVVALDTLDGTANPAIDIDVTLTTSGIAEDGTTTLGSGGDPISMNAAGEVVFAAGTTAGVYTFTYEICEVGNATNCDTAVATLNVLADANSCHAKVDIWFANDISTSVSATEFVDNVSYIVDVSNAIYHDEVYGAQSLLYQWSDTPLQPVIDPLTDTFNDTIPGNGLGISELYTQRGYTNSSTHLDLVLTKLADEINMAPSVHGRRVNVPQVAVIITDISFRQMQTGFTLAQYAQRLRTAGPDGTRIVLVLVAEGADDYYSEPVMKSRIDGMISSNDRLIVTNDYSSIADLTEPYIVETVQGICDVSVFPDAEYDYSDAPTSGTGYHDATHRIVPTIQLGANIDAETGSIASPDADGDGSDDDAVSVLPDLKVGATSYTLPAATISATGTGNLYAWIDFNKNNAFDGHEFVSTTVTDGTVNGDLNWSGLPTLTAGETTFLRLRFTSDTLDAAGFSIDAGDGEVEDYALTISPSVEVGVISGTVYTDSNNNDSYDSGSESGIGSITVSLFNDTNGAAIDTLSTVADGSYSFSGLNAALTYRIEVDATDSDLAGKTIGTTNPLTGISVVADNTTADQNFGFDEAPLVCDSRSYGIYFNSSNNYSAIYEMTGVGTVSNSLETTLLNSSAFPFTSISLTKGLDNKLYSVHNSALSLGEQAEVYVYDPANPSVAATGTGIYLPYPGKNLWWISGGVDPAGNIYFLLKDASYMVKIDLATSQVTTVWSTWPTTTAQAPGGENFGELSVNATSGDTLFYDVTFDSNGDALVTDAEGHYVWKVTNVDSSPTAAYLGSLIGMDSISDPQWINDNGTMRLFGSDANTPDGTHYIDTTTWNTTKIGSISFYDMASCDFGLLTPPEHSVINGHIFEDPGYGGGAGRSYSTADVIDSVGAIVEIYDADGDYLSAVETDVNGSYRLPRLIDNTYYIRVVNDSVDSGRSGSDGSEIAIMTYRSNGVTEVTNEVGGRNPGVADAGANGGSSQLNTSEFTFVGGNLDGGQAQAVQAITVSGGDIQNADFGFNFNTVVNANSSGQGSLQQFVYNNNLLGHSDVQQALPAVVAGDYTAENTVTVFMVPASLLVNDNAEITPDNELRIEEPRVVIDGRVQAANIGSGDIVIKGNGALTAGVYFGEDAGGSVLREVTVSDFGGSGVSIYGSGASSVGGVTVQSVTIKDNQHYGVLLENGAVGNQIIQSTISGNNLAGIANDAASNNTFSQNSISDNGALGIDLGSDGVTENSNSDGWLNYPEIGASSSVSSNGTMIVAYDFDLEVPANTDGYRVEFFSNTVVDPSLHGEGENYLGYIDIDPAGAGSENFKGGLNANQTVLENANISLTLTEKLSETTLGSTSEFSRIRNGGLSVCTDLLADPDAETVDIVLNENSSEVVYLEARDADGNPVTYAISGGADSDRFVIEPEAPGALFDCVTIRFVTDSPIIDNKALSFVKAGGPRQSPPGNYEAPVDSGNDNIYDFEITATDSQGNSMTRPLSVVIRDVNEKPVITSAALVDFLERQNVSTVVMDLQSFDQDADDAEGGGLTYSISGGDDGLRFDVDAQSGELRFVERPDYDAPADRNGDNMYELEVRVRDDQGYSGHKALTVTVTDDPDQGGVSVNIKALLQGAYDWNTGLMSDSLRSLDLLPLNQPYVLEPFNYQGTEALSSASIDLAGDDAIVDWVLVELRNSARPTQVVATMAALLRRNGDVADISLSGSGLIFEDVTPGDYYVSLRHRNHLGVMTAAPLSLGMSPVLVDFSNADVPVYGNHARLSDGEIAMLWSGDVNQDNRLILSGQGSDINPVLTAVLIAPGNEGFNSSYQLPGYNATDLNMDGKVVFTGPSNDANILLGNTLAHPGNANFSGNFIAIGGMP